jgi:hypothetical protein
MGHVVSEAPHISDVFLIFGDLKEISVGPVVIRPQVHCQHGAATAITSRAAAAERGICRRRLRS